MSKKLTYVVRCKDCAVYEEKAGTKLGICRSVSAPARGRLTVYDDYCPYGRDKNDENLRAAYEAEGATT